MARTVKDPEERRRELVSCARQLFYSKGYENTSVSDIVAEAGVAQGTFYYYFESKQAILEATVDQMSEEGMALMRQIVADESLTALEKWNRTLAVTGTWKVERKAEMLALLRVMFRDENLLLRYKVQEQVVPVLAHEFARIIAQGIDEGLFETAYLPETAEIVLSIIYSIQNHLAAILLHPDAYADPRRLVERKLAAVVTAIERVLGAPAGSLTLIEPATLAAWFDDRA